MLAVQQVLELTAKCLRFFVSVRTCPVIRKQTVRKQADYSFCTEIKINLSVGNSQRKHLNAVVCIVYKLGAS